VELAVRLREQRGGQVTLLSVASPEAEETLDLYLGLGAEALVRVWDPLLAGVDAAAVALILAAAARRLRPDLILCGDRALGGDGTGLTGPTVAERLDWPFAGSIVAAASAIEPAERASEHARHPPSDDGRLIVHRLIERGDRQLLRIPLPAVIAVSPEADPPRYPAFARVRRAARSSLDLEALDLIPAATAAALERCPAACSPTQVTGWAPARPRPKKLFVPPSTASAADRLRMVMSGGRARPTGDNLVEAPPERAAEQIMQFLRQERLIASAGEE
jgi:electron transfer flavoprotein beta subunit